MVLKNNALYKNLKTNQDIPKTLKEIFENQVSNYHEFWLMNFSLNYITWLEMLNNDGYREMLNEETYVSKLIKYIKKNMKEMNQIEYTPRMVKTKINTFLKYKEQFKTSVEVLTGYGEQLKTIEYVINRKEAKFKNNYINIENDEAFSGRVLQFIFNQEENILINDKIKQVVSQLPIRMTRNKFLDYIDFAIDKYRDGNIKHLEEYIQLMKDTIYPEGIEGYGQHFMSIYTHLEGMLKIDLDTLSEEDYNFMVDELELTAKKIEQTLAFYLLTVDLLNSLIGMMYCVKYINSNNSRSVSDGLMLIELINEQKLYHFELNEEIEAALSPIEGEFEKAIDNVVGYNELVSSALQSYANAIERLELVEQYDDLERLETLRSTSQFVSLDKPTEEATQVDEMTLAKAKKGMAVFLKEHLDTKQRVISRAIMSNLFVILPVVFKTPREVYDYILNALSYCRDSDEKNAAKQLIDQIIKEYEI